MQQLRAGLLPLMRAPFDALAAAHGRLFGFVPICIALGVGGYFALPYEPGTAAWVLVAVLGLAACLPGLRGPPWARPLAAALALVCLGLGLAGLRTHMVAAPVLDRYYYGPVEGRIVIIDRSGSDAVRLTLDQVVLANRTPAQTPQRIRVALHGSQGFIDPVPGLRVIMTARLGPPGGPVEPGGFAFERLAWFQRLGAVGFTRTPVLALAPPEPGGMGQAITQLRMHISNAVQARMPGEPGAFAAAILTGDRSGIGRGTLEDLRGSNLAHLLAISGLHMGLLTGIVFAMLRYGLALVPPLALRLPAKKIAAVVALGAAGFYLLLSGGNVATERAFVMVAVMLVAVLADRRAISLRSVAIAAIIILALRPEALLEAGFQMSFAATVALVAVFERLRRAPGERARAAVSASAALRALRPVLNGALGLVICSVVAGLATAPVAAAHFNRIAGYGLLANLLSVPLMGSVVMPAAVAAGVLAPLGLADLPLWVMEQGTRWILGVAAFVAGLDGAVTPVPAPPSWVLPTLALGALWLILWPGPARWAGAGLAVLALAGWVEVRRPALLVADSGTLVGVMTTQGRVLSKSTGERFVAEAWLAADGDGADPASAHARPGMQHRDGVLLMRVGGLEVAHLTGRGATGRLPQACALADLVILGARAELSAVPAGCLVIDQRTLARTGALALWPRGAAVEVRPARRGANRRPWMPRPAPGDRLPAKMVLSASAQ